MDYIVKTEALAKQYNKHNAIVNVDMSVRSGAVYGLVGRNGSGKMTILKIIGGLARASSGKICFDNVKQDSEQGALKIGMLIEQPELFEKFGKNGTNVQYDFETYYFNLTGGCENA